MNSKSLIQALANSISDQFGKKIAKLIEKVDSGPEIWLIAPDQAGARGTAPITSIERMRGRVLLVTDSTFEVKGAIPAELVKAPTESPIPQPRNLAPEPTATQTPEPTPTEA